MKKLIVFLMLLSLVLAGTALAATDKLPKSLQGVDLKDAQKVTDTQARTVRGTAVEPQANRNPWAGDGIKDLFLFGEPGPHKLDRIPCPYPSL